MIFYAHLIEQIQASDAALANNTMLTIYSTILNLAARDSWRYIDSQLPPAYPRVNWNDPADVVMATMSLDLRQKILVLQRTLIVDCIDHCKWVWCKTSESIRLTAYRAIGCGNITVSCN
eukprot:Em0011g326a